MFWWNYRDAVLLLAEEFHMILPILDGHTDSDASFVSIAKNAASIITYIDEHFGGKVLALVGLSLGGQIVVEMLSQRSRIRRQTYISFSAARSGLLSEHPESC